MQSAEWRSEGVEKVCQVCPPSMAKVTVLQHREAGLPSQHTPTDLVCLSGTLYIPFPRRIRYTPYTPIPFTVLQSRYMEVVRQAYGKYETDPLFRCWLDGICTAVEGTEDGMPYKAGAGGAVLRAWRNRRTGADKAAADGLGRLVGA